MPDRRLAPVHAVPRPGLLALLDAGVRAPLTVVIAPAGSGKSVLLAQWVRSRPDLTVAWFEVSAADRDAAHFARRFSAGLSAAHPAVPPVRTQPEMTGGLGETYLDALVGALADVDEEMVIVVDDVQQLRSAQLVDDLWELAERLPHTVHLVLASRVDTGMRLTQHRLRHSLVEIRQHQLLFDDEDTEQLLRLLTGTEVDARTAELVRRHTDGWAAGVQLAGLTLRSRPGDDVMASIAESDRIIVDYLAEEVLDAQAAERRAAMLALSVPDELHPDLVAELVDSGAGGHAGPDILRDLERESMFLTGLAHRPGWYAFHPLFRDLLRMRLRIEHPGLEETLLQRVAAWAQARNDSATAVEALLGARRWEDAMALILTAGREAFELGYAGTVARWLAAVPEEVRRADVDADLLYGITVGISGNSLEAVNVLRLIADNPEVDLGRRTVARSWLGASVQFRPPAERALVDAELAVEALTADPDLSPPPLLQLTQREPSLTLAYGALGRAQLFLGRMEEAERSFHLSLDSVSGAYPPYRIHVLGSLAVLHALSGRLIAAAARADEALLLAAEADLLEHQSTGDAHIARALVAALRGTPDSGSLSLREGVLRASWNARHQLLWLAVLAERIGPCARGPVEVPEPPTPAPPIVRTEFDALALRAARQAGEPEPPHETPAGWSSVTFEEIASLLARGETDAAVRRMREHGTGAASRSLVSRVQQELLQGWLQAFSGDPASSETHLVRALSLAEPEGLLDPFVSAGRAIAALVEALPGAPTAFRREVVRRAGLVGAGATEELPDPLTPREVAILAYLPTRLSNAEIAAREFVSLNTVKTHIARIYRKLDVQSRTAAVDRAADLGLLGPRRPSDP